MENKAIILKFIEVWSRDRSATIYSAENVTKRLQNEINAKCPEGYKYKEVISLEKSESYAWIRAIVAYEQIPR